MKHFFRVSVFLGLFIFSGNAAFASVGSELDQFEKHDQQDRVDQALQSKEEPVVIQVDGSDVTQNSRLDQEG